MPVRAEGVVLSLAVIVGGVAGGDAPHWQPVISTNAARQRTGAAYQCYKAGTVWEAIALSFALAMDATAVSAARGIARRDPRDQLILPLVFGGFQAAMSALGWLGGRWGGPLIAKYQDWVACVLLVGIGAKMIVEALKRDDEAEPPSTGVLTYLGLGIATSIDAAAAGLTLPLLPTDPAVAVALIGGITAVCSALGYLLGRTFAAFDKLEIIGGIVLVGMGLRLVIT